MGLGATFRLLRAGWVLAREGAFSVVGPEALPPAARFGVGVAKLFERREARTAGGAERLTRALNRLGPTYVKFGQTLATRPDIVGAELAGYLAALHDRMEPFDPALVPGLLSAALGDKAGRLTALTPPIAAASIAQVHRATIVDGGVPRTVAVKILRPGIRERFRADIESFYAGARLAERFVPALRRLRPLDVVTVLDRSARLELDLRLEAASISEFTQNTEGETGFNAPRVEWDLSSSDVLTTGWVDGIPLHDHAALDAAGLDRKALAQTLLQAFLRHAIVHGFFHADMHPGNLFATRGGDIVAVDFGIMGRIGRQERRVFADIIYGFITRNYRLIAERHFEIGYVPADQDVDDFALALRAIGEPLHGRRASDISMAKVLGQLFATTELFNMQTRPELVLLQKNMVLVEGVARALDPDLDLWTTAEPVVGTWVRRQSGPLGRLEEAAESLRTAADTVRRLPALLAMGEAALADYHAERRRRALRAARWPQTLLAVALVVLVVLFGWRLIVGF